MNLTNTRALLFLIATILLGCSLRLKISLLNNANEDVSVTMPHISKVAISVKSSAVFEYPQSEQNWTMHLVTASCDYEYQLPKTLEHYERNDSEQSMPVVQVESDFKLYLLPRKTTEVLPVSEYQSLQKDGFPISPDSKTCH